MRLVRKANTGTGTQVNKDLGIQANMGTQVNKDLGIQANTGTQENTSTQANKNRSPLGWLADIDQSFCL